MIEVYLLVAFDFLTHRVQLSLSEGRPPSSPLLGLTGRLGPLFLLDLPTTESYKAAEVP